VKRNQNCRDPRGVRSTRPSIGADRNWMKMIFGQEQKERQLAQSIAS
jgi:hypothetical protein